MTSTVTQTATRCARRQPILRVRTGCLTCRGRKKKCDEVKPVCAGCKRNKLECEWPTTTQDKRNSRNGSRKKSVISSQPRDEAAISPKQQPGPSPRQIASSAANRDMSPARTADSPSPSFDIAQHQVNYDDEEQPRSIHADSPDDKSTSNTSQTTSPQTSSEANDDNHVFQDVDWLPDFPELTMDDTVIEVRACEPHLTTACQSELVKPPGSTFDIFNSMGTMVPRNIPLLPDVDQPSYELLSHYLSRTALSMGNGSTDCNPFVSQLIPLAFANEFVLGLVLCQSAVQRATEDTTHMALAQKYYNNSLRSFRKSIDDYINGKEMSPLWIALGALIMCFTETAKGDVHGTIFDHMGAAGPLLSNLMSRDDSLPEGLRDFIVEYFVDLVTIGMISVDPSYAAAPMLDPQFQQMAERMVAKGYVGQLCGTWLELLLLMPHIFNFAQRSATPEPDDFIMFSTLDTQISSFVPSTPAGTDPALSGQIFKQAVHIYLLTALDIKGSPKSQVKQRVDACVAEAFACLWQLPSHTRINTSLLWALAVIGSCVQDDTLQAELLDRLSVMFLAIGLGNIRTTSLLLQEMWKLPETERNPWIISRVMRENDIWMSFV